jgi:hypothetical protein
VTQYERGGVDLEPFARSVRENEALGGWVNVQSFLQHRFQLFHICTRYVQLPRSRNAQSVLSYELVRKCVNIRIYGATGKNTRQKKDARNFVQPYHACLGGAKLYAQRDALWLAM